MKDPEIMLFGTKILLPDKGRGLVADREYSGESCVESSNGSGRDRVRCSDAQEKKNDNHEDHQEEQHQCETNRDRINPGAAGDSHRGTNTSTGSDDTPKHENEQSNSSTTTTNALKKPDKILPCPRCNSSDTKFCYYNNYNVSQPRHFCKGCQRYWTDGGTMRNVPVGAGRRKSKNYYASHCHHLPISEARMDVPNGFNHNMKLKPSGVLSFGPDLPLCESMASGVDISQNDYKNGMSMSVTQNPNGFQYPLVPFPYPTVYSLPYYYTPWLSEVQAPTASQNAVLSTEPSSVLGKHSRNGELLKKKDSESPIVVPRTLRMDDPKEAAKSSVRSALGIECDPFVSREGLLNALQHKGDVRKSTVKTLPSIQANPAALSRSISFQEGVN